MSQARWGEPLDTQYKWLKDYKIDPVQVGSMCEKYPALLVAWNQFKTTYEICDSNETNRQIP